MRSGAVLEYGEHRNREIGVRSRFIHVPSDAHGHDDVFEIGVFG